MCSMSVTLDNMKEYTQLVMQSVCRSLEDDRINSFDFFECPRRSSAGLLEATFTGHTLNRGTHRKSCTRQEKGPA